MKCNWEECEAEFTPTKSWQKFCCPQHRDAWHYREKLRADVREAEQLRLGLDFTALSSKPELVVKRRKILTVEDRRAAE
jgi:hypothetical protein